MFFVYWLLFVVVLLVGIFLGSCLGGTTVMYVLGLLLVAAVLAALATIVTKLGDLEEKIDKLQRRSEDDSHE